MKSNSNDFLEATVPNQENFLDQTVAIDQPSFLFDTEAETDPVAFFNQRRDSLLSNVSMEFGGDLDFGRTTSQLPRGIWNLFAINPDTDFERLHTDIQNLETNNPELASTPEGQAYIKDIRARARVVLDTDEMAIGETLNLLGEMASNQSSELIDMLAMGVVEDPLFPIMIAAGWGAGATAGTKAIHQGNLGKLIARMKTGTAAQRAAAIPLEAAAATIGAASVEGGLGFTYEMLQNKALGVNPMRNAQTMAAINAVLTGGAMGLRTAFKMLKGYPGGYKTMDEALADIQKHIEDNGGIPDELPEIIVKLRENMSELPKASADKALNKSKVAGIKETLAPFNPFRQKKSEVVDNLDQIVKRIQDDFGAEPEVSPGKGVSSIYENTGINAAAGTTAKGGLYYNLTKLLDDFRSGYGFLRGETKKGTQGTSTNAQARREAFKDFDFKEFEKWIMKNGGANAYTEFLLRLEAGKARYGSSRVSLADAYRRSAFEALKTMGGDPRRFAKGTLNKAKLGLEAGLTYGKRSVEQVIRDPGLLYRPVKDVLLGTKQFVKDIATGPAEGKIAYAKARNNISNVLRDWEGGRMAGELAINDFAHFIKNSLGNQGKLDAMSHYLEGNLKGYNQRRIKQGMSAVELSAKDMELAPTIRQFFNDMLDWTQRAELFSDFRGNYALYNAARGYTTGKRGVDYVKGKKAKELDQEMWEYLKKLEDPFDVAEEITPKHRRDSDRSYRLRSRQNYVPHVTRRNFAPDDTSIFQDTLMDAHRAMQLQTTSRFTKKRTHDTMTDALDAGETLLTEDISSLIRIYGKSMLRSQVNNRLISQLSKMKSLATGKPMIGAKHQVPDWYVEFKHPNFKTGPRGEDYLYVNPNLAPDLRLYFDTNDPNIANRILQNIILISKRAQLGLSLFHMMALGWSGLVTGQSPVQVAKNLLPLGRAFKSKGLKAIAGEEGEHEILMGMRNGLGLGVLEELKGDTLINAMRRIGKFAEEKTAGNMLLKPIGKMGNMGMRTLARTQEIIDTHLWDHVNTGLKSTSYITVLEKLVLRDAQQAAKTGRPLTDKNLLRQRAAQFVNDAYGNQNWNQMAMNVENHMGHRIAAALNKPSMRGYIRMLVFAPDWTLSNMRVIGKALDISDKAHPEYMAYAIRSALLFAMVAETLQQTSGQGSIFDDSLKDALRPDLGDGKQMEISKQLAEVIRIFIHGPAHVATHKMGTLPKAYMKADSVGDFFGEFAKSSQPITLQQYQKDPEAGIAGLLGVPIYKKY